MFSKDIFYEQIDILNAFKSPDEVASLMRRTGNQGWIHDARSCPVANYLKDRVGAVITVLGTQIVAGSGSGEIVFARPRWALSTFIKDFDRGLYLDLIVGRPEVVIC